MPLKYLFKSFGYHSQLFIYIISRFILLHLNAIRLYYKSLLWCLLFSFF